MAHLFVDISSHGFGHLAQSAPVLNRLAQLRPGLRVTLRCGLPRAKLAQRLTIPFTHIPTASDFGYRMIDAMTIDRPATAAAYRAAHADFAAQVTAEAQLLRDIGATAVFANVSCLPLAGAARCNLPAVAMCSLNWADLFAHFFGDEPWAAPIHAAMLAAYRTATFLRPTPAMPMTAFDQVVTVGALATVGRERRAELERKILGENVGTGDTARIVLVALGGIPTRLPVATWPSLAGTHWLVPAAWAVQRPDMTPFEPLAWPFIDLLASVDAVITKPGYGTFAEAAVNGTPVLYQRRDDWPEQDCLIDWLHRHARAVEVDAQTLHDGCLGPALTALATIPAPPRPAPTGIEEAAHHLANLLT